MLAYILFFILLTPNASQPYGKRLLEGIMHVTEVLFIYFSMQVCLKFQR